MNAVELLERMLLIRAYEERLAALQKQGPAPMSCSSQGQEASAVGVMAALRAQDRILTNHRSAGHLLARGADPGRILAEVLGKAAGYCQGKSGSLHISVKELGVVLTSTIVGGELSMAPGVALAMQMRREPGVVTCLFGDGAACEGIFHESLNLATVWRLPILYVCENNQWQAFVRRQEAMRTEHVSDWAKGYGLPTRVVDGNDVGAVLDAAQAAVAHIESDGGPYLLETWTYRQRGHYSGDTEAHISAEERAPWLARDPIERQRQRLAHEGVLDAAAFEALAARARGRIEGALAFAQEAPYPLPDQLLTDVYA
ncbi:thiamine pyrophosphate-dependent dehydrogenase E1 component subunit alpha [Azohydromonas caseinilytica]|uniref:Thiamine pyrophosphate-dependent dehydrogenase E1 component subunit alpha n=1 Tax=Azohydromonas caseinilytica TaxID=2728836 RepID=A0A848FHY9_9BURK|nr:thiamine pyrophosphate-dependent dehydrogenase E1 component subunit alpha [Azohydromonas caseinilytica]NML18872.1 thiamine pyrophosphate-dependent dehydrogenase E1 component subunit alpha [Azohydromonas caseinilytica]